MDATMKNATANEIVRKLEAAGVKIKSAFDHTNGGATVKFAVSQNGKARDASYEVEPSGKVAGSKYTYLLPNDLNSEIETG